MLYEQRRYTLRPGTTSAFWQAQVDRGFDLVKPIQQRLVGYFHNLNGPGDEITHLYRYDSFDDWKERLHGLYGVPSLQPYFKSVRALMTAQQNQFFSAAPITALNPLWKDGTDEAPGSPGLPPAGATPDSLIEEQSTILLPGTVPAYWQAWHTVLHGPDAAGTDNMLATLVSLVGRQHQIVTYRHFSNTVALESYRYARAHAPLWSDFLATTEPLTVSNEIRLLRPAPLEELSPLFYPRKRHDRHS